jgi:acyl-CoA thioester hydrolase
VPIQAAKLDAALDAKLDIDPAETAWRWQARVYYEDTDAGGIVFYANYLRFFERARTEWLRHLGFEHVRMRKQFGLIFVVKELHVNYHKPAKLDDMVQLGVKLITLKRASLMMEQTAYLETCPGGDSTLLASAEIRLACLDAQSLKPMALPKELGLVLA